MKTPEEKAKHAAAMRAWRKANPVKYKANARRHYQKTKEQRNAESRVYHAANKDRVREVQKAWRIKNADWQRDRRRALTYGTDGKLKFIAQGGLCALCRCDLTALPSERQHLDHDHETGRVRSWLCANCNRALGQFNDDPAVLRKAADYIESYK